MHQRTTYGAAVADAQYELPYAMTVDATAVPHAPSAQSRSPYPKLTFSQRHEGTGLAHPSAEYCATTLLKHVCPHDGSAASPVVVAVCVANAAAQYALPKAMALLAAAASVPQAPLEQSRRPLPKSALLQRQYESWGLAQPRVEYCASMLLKQVWPHAGRSDSPGTTVLGAVVVAGVVVDGVVDVEVVLGVEEDEVVVMAEEDEVVELEEEPVAEELQFPY